LAAFHVLPHSKFKRVFHRAWPDLQRMKLLLPVARSCRVSFFLSDSMKPIICSAWSFRGATEGGEPGLHSPRPPLMDSGLAASRRPGMTSI